jgi:succinyl-CoA synthetase alpha subunit
LTDNFENNELILECLEYRPIVALVGGIKAVPGRIMGHAGAFALPGEPTALEKVEVLKVAGVSIVNHPSRFGPVLKSLLAGTSPSGADIAGAGGVAQQRRAIHTHTRRPAQRQRNVPVLTLPSQGQRRSIYLTKQTALDLLRLRGVVIHENTSTTENEKFLAASINRESRQPCIVVAPDSSAQYSHRNVAVFDFDPSRGSADLPLGEIAGALGLQNTADQQQHLPEGFSQLVRELVALFLEKEAFVIEARFVLVDEEPKTPGSGVVAVSYARIGLDDAAYRSAGRQADAHALRDVSAEDPHEVAVEREGIAYVKLPDGDAPDAVANIGTLVNGAGLAMNTVDALADAGGRAANFLDTGGKATSETVKRSFEILLTDPRVKVGTTIVTRTHTHTCIHPSPLSAPPFPSSPSPPPNSFSAHLHAPFSSSPSPQTLV